MLQMVLPRPCHREDVQSFYREMEQNGDECIDLRTGIGLICG